MAEPGRDGCIDYIELVVADIAAAKSFYGGALGWTFTDYGPDYCEFFDGRLKGGFAKGTGQGGGGPIVILYASDLEFSLAKVEANGGRVVKPIFRFPGGRRFHFCDPAGYELAMWSEA